MPHGGDLKRIEKLGYKRADFTVHYEGETRLKNRGKTCCFLEDGRCMVYENRPEGCRIYPLVYDVYSHKFISDKVCLHSAEFKATRADKDRLKHLIRRIEKRT
jgi:Fe-S-cluster containining protein